MRNHWYPVAFASELPRGAAATGSRPTDPYGFQLLGDPIVLFRDQHGAAQCVQDKCSHRSAPLSVGTVRDGRLECKYHGWQFGSGGKCESIPSEPTTRPGKPFCVYAYPTTEVYDLVWVWPGDPEKASEQHIPHHLFKEYRDKSWGKDTVTRDFDIEHGLFIENILDPSHLPFTHDGTLSKRAKADEMKVEMLFDNVFGQAPAPRSSADDHQTDAHSHFTLGLPEGFYGMQAQAVWPADASRPAQRFTFQTPCVVRLDLQTSTTKKRPDGSYPTMIQLHFCVPVSPTRFRVNTIFFRNFATKFTASGGFPLGSHLNRWYADKIMDQDVELLTGQMVNLLNAAKPWNTVVRADKIAARYRRWRDQAELTNPWFCGFHQSAVPDIEDLIAAGAEKAETDSVESGSGGSRAALVAGRRRKVEHATPPIVTGPYPRSGAERDLSTLLMQAGGVRFKPRTRIALVPRGVRLAAATLLALLLALLLLAWLRRSAP